MLSVIAETYLVGDTDLTITLGPAPNAVLLVQLLKQSVPLAVLLTLFLYIAGLHDLGNAFSNISSAKQSGVGARGGGVLERRRCPSPF